MMHHFQRWLTSPIFADDEEKTTQANLLNIMLVFILAVLALVMVGIFLGGRTPGPTIIINMMMIANGLLLRHWLYQGKVKRVGVWFVVSGYLLVTASAISLGTVRAPNTAIYLLLVIMVGLLFDRKGIVVSTVLSSLIILGLVLAESAGLLPEPDFSVTITQWITYTVTIGLAGSLTFFGYKRSLDALERSKNEIAERQRVETQLRKLLQAVEQSPTSIVITNLDGNIEYVNPKFTQVTGYSSEEALGKNPRILQSGETTRDTYEDLWGTLVAGQEWRGEFHNKKKNGELYWESVLISPVQGPDGQTTSYLAVKEDITRRKHMENALRESEERFRTIFENSPIAYQSLDESGRFLYLNANLCELLGYQRDELIGRPFFDIWSEEMRPRIEENFTRFIEQGYIQADLQLLHKNGQPLYVILEGRVEHDLNGAFQRTHCVLTDVTEKQTLQTRIQRQNQLLSALNLSTLDFLQQIEFQDLLESLVEQAARLLDAPYGAIMTLEVDALVVRAFTGSQSFLAGQRFGRSQAHLAWQAVDTLEPAVVADYATCEQRSALYAPVEQHAVVEIPMISGDGQTCLGLISLRRSRPDQPFLQDEMEIGRVFAQIAGLAIENAKLHYTLTEQSIRDPLTGLYNRRYLFETLPREFARATRENVSISLIMLDIDHFKTINDAYGHGAGDVALCALAEQFKKMARAGDILCRYGGDEHLIAMYNTPPEAALVRAEQWREQIERLPIPFGDQTLHITISLGIATYPEHATEIDHLINCADGALYQAKSSGRNTSHCYGSALASDSRWETAASHPQLGTGSDDVHAVI